jgi:hypothetical protein
VLFGFQFSIGNVQTLPSDFFGGKSVGSLAGLGGMVGVFSVISHERVDSQGGRIVWLYAGVWCYRIVCATERCCNISLRKKNSTCGGIAKEDIN